MQLGVIVDVRTGVTQAAAEGTHVVGDHPAIHHEEGHAVRAVRGAATGVTFIGIGSEDHLDARVGAVGEAGHDATGFIEAVVGACGIGVREAQRAVPDRVRKIAGVATAQR